MTPLQFYRTVVKMRQLQKLWDRGHNPAVLRQAREWERIIDAEIDRVEVLVKERDTQSSLFDNGNNNG